MTSRHHYRFEVRNLDVVARAQKGDVDAVGLLYDLHQEAIFRYLWARLGERQTAEDLTGEVFLRMLGALPNYQVTAIPFRAWLYRIARNLLVDHYRRTGARPALPLEVAEAASAPDPDPLGHVVRQLSIEKLHHALARLDDAQREVVTLRFLSGLSLQETAATLERTEAAVKALQHRGLATLRQALADEQVIL